MFKTEISPNIKAKYTHINRMIMNKKSYNLEFNEKYSLFTVILWYDLFIYVFKEESDEI